MKLSLLISLLALVASATAHTPLSSSNDCIDHNCARCDISEDQCLECNSGYLMNGTSRCAPCTDPVLGFGDDAKNCLTCQIIGPDSPSNGCSSCKSGYDLRQINTCDFLVGNDPSCTITGCKMPKPPVSALWIYVAVGAGGTFFLIFLICACKFGWWERKAEIFQKFVNFCTKLQTCFMGLGVLFVLTTATLFMTQFLDSCSSQAAFDCPKAYLSCPPAVSYEVLDTISVTCGWSLKTSMITCAALLAVDSLFLFIFLEKRKKKQSPQGSNKALFEKNKSKEELITYWGILVIMGICFGHCFLLYDLYKGYMYIENQEEKGQSTDGVSQFWFIVTAVMNYWVICVACGVNLPGFVKLFKKEKLEEKLTVE